MIRDNLLREPKRKAVFDFLNGPGWVFGWKSSKEKDQFSFWHKHFAGTKGTDHPGPKQEKPYDCTEELKQYPLLSGFWGHLSESVLRGHRLVRCYANGTPYGCDGTLHTDSAANNSFTSVYYPHDRWSPNWGGETVFFNKEETDIIRSIYPKGNRLVMFPGTVPHVARGVARICPVMRITLMFKTDYGR